MFIIFFVVSPLNNKTDKRAVTTRIPTITFILFLIIILLLDPEKAQEYYQETIQSNLTVLVGLLDEVVERGTVLNEESAENMKKTVSTMHIVTAAGLVVVLVCLLSLVLYIMKRIVKPILVITEKTKPLQDGRMKLELDYKANDEIGDLALSRISEAISIFCFALLERSAKVAESSSTALACSVAPCVSTSVPFIGDFQSISDSIDSFTESLSMAISNIQKVEHEVFGYARSLSDGSQALAQGATEQASAVEELSATLADLFLPQSYFLFLPPVQNFQ